jgi:hypothetical protein
MLYWMPETVNGHLSENYLLNHAGSNQLGWVSPGDVLWIVTTAEADELGLAGRLKVGAVVSLNEAKFRLNRYDLWPSHYHALAVPNTAEPMRGISLYEAAGRLRFADEGPDRLTVTLGGAVNPIELRTMRELSAESALLLHQIWVSSRLL